MTLPTDMLRDDHCLILRALDLLEAAADRLAGGDTLPAGWWAELVDWLRAFADHTHHAKEERVLFPAMLEAGLPSEGGPIAVMLEEHDRGRFLVREMELGPPPVQRARARDYVRELREHIAKENGVLLPLAEVILDLEAQGAVARGFERLAEAQGGAGAIVRAGARLDALTDAFLSGRVRA